MKNSLRIYLRSIIKETLLNEQKPACNFVVEFDGTGLPSGLCFYQLQADEFIET